MRHSIPVLCAVIATATVAEAQSSPSRSHMRVQTYLFEASVPVQECAFESGASALNAPLQHTPYGARFSLVGEAVIDNRQRVILQFLQWPTSAPEYRLFNVVLSPVAEARLRSDTSAAAITYADVQPRTFCVDKDVFDRTASQIFAKGSWDLAAGILVLPVKLRGGKNRDFDFSTDVTFGTVAGPRWRIHSQRDVFFSTLIGAGITSVALNAENTNGAVTEATDRAAVTVTTGVMFEVNRFQFGLMLGWDQISNPHQQQWLYQGHRWISLGLGYALLSTPPERPATGN